LSLDGHARGRDHEEDVMRQQRAIAFAIAAMAAAAISAGAAQGTDRETSLPSRHTAGIDASRQPVTDQEAPNALGARLGGAPATENATHTMPIDWRIAGDPRAFLLDAGALARRSGWPGPPNYIGCRGCEPVEIGGISEAMLDRSQ
jgi:hypothetical protein